MTRPVGGTLIATQLLLWWFAGAQMETSSGAQENLRAGSDERGPVIAVSPSVLDFKVVGVGRASDLILTVKNVGGGILKGKATVPGPFSIKGGTYALTSGESKSLTVRYRPQAPGTNSAAVVLAGS